MHHIPLSSAHNPRRGTHQRKTTEKKKVSGTAPLEPVDHRAMLTTVNTSTDTPGKKHATRQHTCRSEAP